MDTNDLDKYYGGADKVRETLDLSRSLYSRWKINGIPYGPQARIQIMTRGKLRSDEFKDLPQRKGKQ